MPYTKTDWTTAKITADNFNKLQTQYAEAVADAIGIRANGTAELRAEVVSSFPAHAPGRIIYHSGLKMFFYSTGTEWLLDPKETFWGDAQNGVFSSTGNVTFTNTLGATVIRNYRNFTLNPGHTITTERGCRCLVIRSWGDITINGVIDLDYKGGFGDRYISIGGVQYDLLGGLGGNGGGNAVDSGLRYAGGLRGAGGVGGGGGGTGSPKNTSFANGGPIAFGGAIFQGSTSYNIRPENGINGAGGGGGASKIQTNGEAEGGFASATTGQRAATGGGGQMRIRSQPSGFSTSPTPMASPQTQSGLAGGGVLVLLAIGSVTINGQIRARGSNGGNGGNGYSGSFNFDSEGGGGAGGSGGGKVIVIRRGTYNNAGSVVLTGGTGGTGGTGAGAPNGKNGSPGETGTISTYQL